MSDTALDPHLDDALTALAAARSRLVALDFDGVLAPIVERPDDARPLPASAAAVRRLVGAPATRVALVSGRHLADLVAVADPPRGTLLVGSHGAERGVVGDDGTPQTRTPDLTEEQRADLEALTATVSALAEPEPQAWVEHKPAGAVVHTRRMHDDAAAALEQRVLDAVAGRQGVRVLHGKRVVELSVLEATKGTALDALRHELDAAGVLYAGDDVTDEDAFAVLGPDDVGVKVGDGETRAAHRVPDPAALGLALDRLADLVLG